MGKDTIDSFIKVATIVGQELIAGASNFDYELYTNGVLKERETQDEAWAARNMEYICDLPQRAPDEENPDYPPCFATLESVQGTLQKVWHHGQMSLWNELLGSKYEPPLLEPNQRPWSLNREEASNGQAFVATHYSADGKISHTYARPVDPTHQGPPYSHQQGTRPDNTLGFPIVSPTPTYSMSALSQNYQQSAPAPYTLSGPEQLQHSAYSGHGSIHPSLPAPVHGSVKQPANQGFGQEHCPF